MFAACMLVKSKALQDPTALVVQECVDETEGDDGQGREQIFRVVRIPFRVAFVTGNLKLRLGVDQDRKAGKVRNVLLWLYTSRRHASNAMGILHTRCSVFIPHVCRAC